MGVNELKIDNEGELWFSTLDEVNCWHPDFQPSIRLINGTPSYYVTHFSEIYEPDPDNPNKNRRRNIDTEVKVSAETWRDLVSLYQVTEISLIKLKLKEALDNEMKGSLTASLQTLATNSEAQ